MILWVTLVAIGGKEDDSKSKDAAKKAVDAAEKEVIILNDTQETEDHIRDNA